MDIIKTETGYRYRNLSLKGLPPRCAQTLLLRAHGYSVAETAQKLGCGVSTIQSRIKDIFFKLKVHTTAAAVTAALTRGLMAVHDDSDGMETRQRLFYLRA